MHLEVVNTDVHTRPQACPPQFRLLDSNLRFLEKCPAEGTGAPTLEEGTCQETGTKKEDAHQHPGPKPEASTLRNSPAAGSRCALRPVSHSLT